MARMIAFVACAVAMNQDFTQLAKKFEPEKKPKLLIVGFYHFSNPGLDLAKSDLDDHLSPKRQAEIEEVVAKLAEFKPTKVAVEVPSGNAKVNEDFAAWVGGKRSLSSSETEQVGFRLAQKSGLSGVEPVDHRMDMDFETFMKKADPKAVGELQTTIGEVQKFMAGFKDHKVSENLRALNTPEADRFSNGFYLRMLKAGHAGADLVAPWWTRNLYWLSNISAVASKPEERIVVLCGSGHASLMRSLLRDSIDYQVVPANDYLP
ncbi:MAG: DUF5694 domain-containing protein [bacterium]